jgi:glycosyltransferase involved in cell wall biosynthesis
MDRRMTSSEITLVVPTYNGERYIKETLDSVANQSLPPSEVIVVDDYSRDNTLAIVQQYSRKVFPPLRIVELSENSGGPAKPMNIGVQEAKTKYVAVLDQDDVLMPRRFELAYRALEMNLDAALAFGNYLEINSDGMEVEATASQLIFSCLDNRHAYDAFGVMRCCGEEWLREFYFEPGLQRSCSNHFFRKSAWNKVGGYRENAKLAADYDFVIRMFDQGIVWLSALQFMKRTHEGNCWVNSVEAEFQLLKLQDYLADCIGSKDLFRLRNECFCNKSRKFRWAGLYSEAKLSALHLIKKGCVVQGIVEYGKALACEYGAGVTRRLS